MLEDLALEREKMKMADRQFEVIKKDG